jgi:hypothetical protein
MDIYSFRKFDFQDLQRVQVDNEFVALLLIGERDVWVVAQFSLSRPKYE